MPRLQPVTEYPSTRFNCIVPVYLKDQFKAACSFNGYQMTTAVKILMKSYIDGHQGVINALNETYLKIKEEGDKDLLQPD